MARAITSPELALLRGDGPWTKLYLAIYQPNTIYTALLNGVPASNDRVYQISFDGGAGTLGDVKANMTLYVGTVAGAYDLGMCRIRKAPIAGTFYIGLTSEIVFADNCYLTVVDDFDLWAKHATVASGVLSMDVDVGYSDQHSAFNPVPVLGSHAVAWLDAATVNVAFAASNSWVIGSTISAYAWTAPGSSASSGMSTATPTVTYNATGCYRVFCTVTAANGKTTTGVRHVFVYDRDANPPATVFQLSQCVEDYDTGGWMFDMTMEAEASMSEIHDRALIVLFAEDWYGGERQSIGPIVNRENIVCVGRIAGESIRWDRESGLVHFTVHGLHHWLNKVKAFPVELFFVGSATDWAGMPALTVDRALWHILYWHSTAIETMDFYRTNDSRYAVDAKTIASTIWGQLGDLAFSKIVAAPGVDRFGRLFVEVDPQMVPEADRDWATVMTITEADWQETIQFQRVIVNECSLISLNAQEVNSAGSSVTRYSLWPGHVPLRHGEPEMTDRVLCSSQANANSLAGLLGGWRTNQYPDVPVVFAQNNRMMDCFPRQFCAITVASADTPREVAFTLNLIPRRVTYLFDGDTGYFHGEVNFEGETLEGMSTNGDIPDIDEIDMEIPPIPSLPPLPDLPIILPGLPGEPTPSGPKKVLVHDPDKGLLLSVNFNTLAPSWITINAGLTVTQYQKINHVVICPNGAVYVGYISQPSVDAFLARAPYLGGTFVIIENSTSLVAKFGGSDTTVQIGCFGCNLFAAEAVAYIAASAGVAKAFYGSVSTFNEGAALTNMERGGSISYGAGKWLLTYEGWSAGPKGYWRTLNADCSVADAESAAWHYLWIRHIRLGTTGTTFHYFDETTAKLRVGTINLAAYTDIGEQIYAGAAAQNSVMAVDYTGAQLMTSYGANFKGKTSDGGATWSTIGSLPVVGNNWRFAFAGGAGSTSRWVAGYSYLYYSEDFGTTWVDKRGNILSIVPILLLDIVMVVEK